MKIYLADKLISIASDFSLASVLVDNGYTQPHFAVAINQHFVPRSQYASTFLKENDVIDIIMPMQGG